MLYLVAYPFECSEQLASRILAIAALRDVLTAFQAEGLPPPKEIDAAVTRDIERLQAMQNDDGGFADLAPGRGVVAVSQHPRGQRAAACKAEGLRRAPGIAREA